MEKSQKGKGSSLQERKNQTSKQICCKNLSILLQNLVLKAFGGCYRFWQTAGEREGENPMKTPLPYIIIFGMSTPFVILAIAFVNGWIKVPVR